MTRVAGADQRQRNLGLVEHVAGGDRRDAAGMFLRDAVQHAQQPLERLPAAEVLDDQPVLDQRTVGQLAGRRRLPEPPLRQEAAGDGAVAEQMHAMRPAQLDHAVLGPVIEQRVLELVAEQRNAGLDDPSKPGHVEVRGADVRELAGALAILQPRQRPQAARHLVVPPVELHDVEPFDAEPAQRGIDRLLDVRAGQPRQQLLIRRVLGGDPQPSRELRIFAAERAYRVLDADVVIGTVERVDAGLDEAAHVLDRLVDRSRPAVPGGELPVALGHPRDRVVGRQRDRLDVHDAFPRKRSNARRLSGLKPALSRTRPSGRARSSSPGSMSCR